MVPHIVYCSLSYRLTNRNYKLTKDATKITAIYKMNCAVNLPITASEIRSGKLSLLL